MATVWRLEGAALLGAILLPVAAWGLVAFAAYQHFAFGDALAFGKAQDGYRMREGIDLGAKIIKLITLEPIWANYLPRSDAWWGIFSGRVVPNLLFSLRFWNPIYFVGAVAFVLVGWWKKWLDGYELALSAGLLLIPYVTRGYDFGMCSQARFAAVCFPAFLVLGRLMAALPLAWRVMILAFCTFYLAVFSMMFSAGYPIF